MPQSAVHSLDPDRFAADYLRPGFPVVVRGALADWTAAPPWDLAALGTRFGGHQVPFYDTLFSLQGRLDVRRIHGRIHTGRRTPAARRTCAGSPSRAATGCRGRTRRSASCRGVVDAVLAAGLRLRLPPHPGPVDRGTPTPSRPADCSSAAPAGGPGCTPTRGPATPACARSPAASGSSCTRPSRPRCWPTGPARGRSRTARRPRFPRWRRHSRHSRRSRPGDAIFIPAGWYHAASHCPTASRSPGTSCTTSTRAVHRVPARRRVGRPDVSYFRSTATD